MEFWPKPLASDPPRTVKRTGVSTELQNLAIDEISGVDLPAHNIPGWLVMKAAAMRSATRATKADKKKLRWEVLKSRDGSPVRDDEGWLVAADGESLINPLAVRLGIVKVAGGSDIYQGNMTYEAPLTSPNGGGSPLSPYNDEWNKGTGPGYGPTGIPDTASMDPVAQVEALGTLLDHHGPVEFHRHARTIPPTHLHEAAAHARRLGNDKVCGACLAAAADTQHTEAMDPSGPADHPVLPANPADMMEGIDALVPGVQLPRYLTRYGSKPVKKAALKRKHVLFLDTGVDPKSPRDLNVCHANYGELGVQHLVAKLKPSEASALAVNARVHPHVRRILARRGRNAQNVAAVFRGSG